ncbi:MAG TPA: hypothetical protein VHQ43_07150 [Solirubrobacterales bacterium]|jgi:hypothetical protein|nr:hypothetical protein [Solirubrobacterales bacterium]
MLESIRAKAALLFCLCALFALSLVGTAGAVAQDYTAVTDDAASEITAAVPVALGVAGLFVGIMLAYKVLRRMIRA